MFVISHAFSRRNAGDGLLVDLTFELLDDAGIGRRDCTVLALDAPSFADLDHVVQAPGEPAARPSIDLLSAGLELARSATGGGRVEALIEKADAVVAVGGGYLVADSPVRQLGVMLNHFAQVRAAARSRKPTIYLPQSIGPLDEPAGSMLRRELRQIDRIFVRDDQTLAELGWDNVRRCADLAAMKLSRSLGDFDTRARRSGPTVIVARDLPASGLYRQRLGSLAALLDGPAWAVQADSEGRRSDRKFYQRMGMESSGTLAAMLDEAAPAVVISVRLHGAIAALLKGCPAIHLAYERKGWGAYQDLGLGEYVHDARSFDPALVASQAAALRDDASEFWARVGAAAGALRTQYSDLVAEVRQRLSG